MRVIAIDDERLILKGTMQLLEKVLPEAEIAGYMDGEEALAELKEKPAQIALLDIQMPEISGLELAKRCREICPKINIIFVTGYSDYAVEAFHTRASGYLMKPLVEEKLRIELENLRYDSQGEKHRKNVRVQTFGGFEVFVNGNIIYFKRSKVKECLAYLIDKRGAFVANKDLGEVLFAGMTVKEGYTRKIISELHKLLVKEGIEDIILKKWKELAINMDRIECEDAEGAEHLSDEYMKGYSWAEKST